MRIGLDFDNTLARYDQVFTNAARESNLINSDWLGTKKELRDRLRAQPEGELEWQKLQGMVYGRYMSEAELFPGVANFLLRCKRLNVELVIISHKTVFGHFDAEKVPLREEAWNWMKSKDFFNVDKYGISPNAVFFSSTRQEKVEQISKLQLDAFVDDLEEVFAEPEFPGSIRKILFGANSCETTYHDVCCCNWTEISRELLGKPSLEDYRYWSQTICGNEVTEINELQGSGNSRVHRIQTENGTTYVMKTYPDRLLDSRNRIEAEFNACRYLENTDLAPKAIELDRDLNIGIYEWVEGRPVQQVENSHIVEALSFTQYLWSVSQSPEASFFPLASEACISADQLFSQIDTRFEKLKNCSKDIESLEDFLESVFKPTWLVTRSWVEKLWPIDNQNKILPQENQTLSPSDFGFHNSLIRRDRTLCFLDLEYFGFDDPVKLIADFIWHPAMYLSDVQKKQWVQECFKIFSNNPQLESRFRAAWPMYGLRWAMILLNEFHKEGWEKRIHANQELLKTRDDKLAEQLNKATRLCELLNSQKMECPYV